jgi:hypothetical protein
VNTKHSRVQKGNSNIISPNHHDAAFMIVHQKMELSKAAESAHRRNGDEIVTLWIVTIGGAYDIMRFERYEGFF